MTAHPLAYPNYLRFASIVREREYFRDEEIKDLCDLQAHEGFVDSQGHPWCLGALIGKAWIERRYESRSLANALEALEKTNPEWATSKALAWLAAAAWEPKGDPEDPNSLHATAVRDLLEKKLGGMGREQWLAIGDEAMDILSQIWEKGSTLDSASVTSERHVKTWTMFSLYWAEGKSLWPFASHPRWPQWVADKTLQTFAGIQIAGVGPQNVGTLLNLQGSPDAQPEDWARAWAHVAEQTWHLFQALDAHPNTTVLQRMQVDLLPAVSGVFCLMACTNGQAPQSLDEILVAASDQLNKWEHGVVPYTERKYLGASYDAMKNRLQEVRMDREIAMESGGQPKNKPGRF